MLRAEVTLLRIAVHGSLHIDGHHKIEAAAAAGLPVRVAELLAIDHGVSTADDVELPSRAWTMPLSN